MRASEWQKLLSLKSWTHHLPIVFHIMELVLTRNLPDPIEKFMDWDRSQNLASDLASSRIHINSAQED
jgi:hypothetical protein